MSLLPHNALARIRTHAWTIGVVVASFVVAWIPYWIINLLNRPSLRMPWWRVPVATPGVFDSYVYLNWMGAAALGLPYGGHLRWFGLIVQGVWAVAGEWASIPEVWILTRWLSIALLLLLGAWSIRVWSGISVARARFLIAAFAFSIALSIGIRPGAYSWYVPFAFAGFAAAWRAGESLHRSRIRQAIGWSLLAFACTSLYPWYLMPCGVWLASLWGAWIVQHGRKWFFAAIAAIAGLVALAAIPVAQAVLRPSFAGILGVYERSGIVFSRVPFFANTILAFGAWIVLLGVLAYAVRERPFAQARVVQTAWAWLALILQWFSTPITGIHLYSDHLIAPTIVLALFSLATLWSVERDVRAWEGNTRVQRVIRAMPLVIAACATLFLLYILQQPLRFNAHKFDSYVVHVLHWFALALAAWIIAARFHKKSLSARTVVAVFATGSALVGLWGLIAVLVRDTRQLPALIPRAAAISEIRFFGNQHDALCASPKTAHFYAAHTGRWINPAEAMLSYAIPSDEVTRMFETLAGAYDVKASGDLGLFRLYTDHYRTIPCAAASKFSHNAGWFNALRRLGVSESATNELIGCRQSVIDANWAIVASAIERHQLNESAFRSLCPSVIVPDDEKAFWTLPSSYREIRIGPDVALWSERSRF